MKIKPMQSGGFVIDKITNSVEEVSTGQSLPTVVQLVTQEDLKAVLRKNGWLFNWKQEYAKENRQVYKILLDTEDSTMQGLISLQPKKSDDYIEMHLIESAPHNLGSKKRYVGVPANLVAFACKMSFEMGFDGFVAFIAKTALVKHYIDTRAPLHMVTVIG